jgi:hypothetical protein
VRPQVRRSWYPDYQGAAQGKLQDQRFAKVVIGGLLTSTVLTLIVLPVLYEWLEEHWPRWAASLSRGRKAEPQSRAQAPPEPAGHGD